MLDEIKPCPFCGHTDLTVGVRHGDEYIVVACKNCEAFGPSDFASYVIAQMAWNRRPAEDALVTQVAALQADKIALRRALLLVLDKVDYVEGDCRSNDWVGSVLTEEVIARARIALEATREKD